MKKESFIVIGIIIITIIFFVWYSGLFSPEKPAVVVDMQKNQTTILRFDYARSPGTLQCAACEVYYAKVWVYYNGTIICESEESLISLGSARISVRCDKSLEEYEGKTVKVIAEGRVTPAGAGTIISKDEQILNLTFK